MLAIHNQSGVCDGMQPSRLPKPKLALMLHGAHFGPDKGAFQLLLPNTAGSRLFRDVTFPRIWTGSKGHAILREGLPRPDARLRHVRQIQVTRPGLGRFQRDLRRNRRWPRLPCSREKPEDAELDSAGSREPDWLQSYTTR